ncbi:hypothetical protein HPP92_014053 [Vanilla planifolia]|uniref:Uncharacterized protein n=1 Tax=Vanilla planifolia TaxID=51239 RepID=A0A835UUE2_VANPL|nr:hypothetical protein HPP92_014053 [Vanilla planifolia]
MRSDRVRFLPFWGEAKFIHGSFRLAGYGLMIVGGTHVPCLVCLTNLVGRLATGLLQYGNRRTLADVVD